MKTVFTIFLQFILQSFTVVLQFFAHAINFGSKALAKNFYSFYNNFSPLRARVFFLFALFFLTSAYYKKSVKSVRKFKKSVPQGFIWFFKNCKVTVIVCKVTVNKTVKGVVGYEQ